MDREDNSLFEEMVSGGTADFLTGVIDSIQDGAAVYDAQDRLVYFNQSYTQYFKLVEDILKPGITFQEIFRALGERGLYDGPAENIGDWVEHRVKLFKEGSIANEVRRNDGRWIRIDYYKLANGGTFVVSADITQRKRNEEELRQAKEELEIRVQERTAELQALYEKLEISEARIRALMDNSPFHIYLKDTEGRFLLVNRLVEQTLDLPADQIIGHTLGDFYPPDVTKPYLEQDREVLETRRPCIREYPAPQAKGRARTSLFYKFPIFETDEDISAIGVIIVDIDDRKRFEQQLEESKVAAEQANWAKSQFLANMSHELRTPLNAVIGYAELLTETAEDEGWDEEAIGDLSKIKASGRHLLSLINSVLDLSKIEAGKMELFTENFSIPDMIDDIADSLKPLAEKNGNRITTECPPDVGEMRSDLTKIRQILFNLMSNAVKFTEDGTVTIQASRRGMDKEAVIQFDVVDTGIGISQSDLAVVFDSFTQAEGTMAGTSGGTGLGLSITKRFCELLGGSVTAESVVGQGSRFTVVLPAVLDAAPDATVGSLAEAGGTKRPGRPTILVIDDDPAVRDLLSRRLGSNGFNVSVAETGTDGLAMAKHARPDAITLDILMPGMDGWAVLQALKDDPALTGIPVIMVSITEETSRGFSMGAVGHLEKPIDQTRLVNLLRAHCPVARRVLLVEDEEAMRHLLRNSLEDGHYIVDEAGNGVEALDRLSLRQPDLIILDLMMPEMDGFELLTRLRNNIAWRDIPIAAVTAKDLTPEDWQRLDGGIQLVLSKSPENIETIVERLQSLSPMDG
ncbi:MAG: response regulator [Alphaproteobacteria bacterium]